MQQAIKGITQMQLKLYTDSKFRYYVRFCLSIHDACCTNEFERLSRKIHGAIRCSLRKNLQGSKSISSKSSNCLNICQAVVSEESLMKVVDFCCMKRQKRGDENDYMQFFEFPDFIRAFKVSFFYFLTFRSCQKLVTKTLTRLMRAGSK